ncbi:MAG: radical SAM-associated putative lipoprotein [Treponema sp.]|jgi:putative lipoprotein (rSAM/lipoprotein system)|nr:radical SAM-associated putative lipoprotein [Treponema sp.]
MKMTKGIGRKILRKIYTGLGLTAVALVFQACYGTPQTMGLDVLIRGVVKSKKTEEPIEGIKVSVKDMDQAELTNSAGKFQIYVPQEEFYTIQFEDIDGAENGSYSSTEIHVDFSNDKIDLDIISLDDAK